MARAGYVGSTLVHTTRSTTSGPSAGTRSAGQIAANVTPRFSDARLLLPEPGALSVLTAMKEGLLGGTLHVFTVKRAGGGPFTCCTLDWISVASASTFACSPRMESRR